MWVKNLLLLFGISTLSVVGTFAQDGAEDLLCLNNKCFVPESTPETVVLKDSVALERDLNPEVDDYFAPVSENTIPYTENLFEFDDSKYYSILNPDVPFFKKRFLNVRAWDMIYGTHPEYESTRPNIVIEFFNKPKYTVVDFYWEE